MLSLPDTSSSYSYYYSSTGRPTSTAFLLVCAAFVAFSLAVVYHTLQHKPLSKLPGPWYSAFTGLVLLWHEYQGTRRLYVHDLHKRYGSTVRLSPNEASFTGAAAVKQIYSGANGYEKPRFFDLFMQKGTRYCIPLVMTGCQQVGTCL